MYTHCTTTETQKKGLLLEDGCKLQELQLKVKKVPVLQEKSCFHFTSLHYFNSALGLLPDKILLRGNIWWQNHAKFPV